MTKPFEKWTVLPHSKLTHIDDKLLCVTGELHMPFGDFPRRMTVARLQNGKLVVFSAIALEENEMKELEAFGHPAYLIVPSDIHRMDAKIWKDRYPDMVVIAPPGVRDKVEEVVHVDRTTANFGDPAVRYVVVPGTGEREAALVVQTSTGTTLVVNDLIFNVHDRKGFAGWLFKLMQVTGSEPHITKLVKARAIKDKPAVARQLEAWSRLDRLNRIIVAHGDIVTREPSIVLAHLAHTLAA